MQKPSSLSISENILNFDQLPNDAYIRVKDVSRLLGVSVPTVWRKSKAGTFPKPCKLSARISGWRVGDLRGYLEALTTRQSA